MVLLSLKSSYFRLQSVAMSDIKESLKKYIDARLRLTELQWKEELAVLAAKTVYLLIIILALGFGLVLLSTALALLLGAMLGGTYWGFFMMGAFYALVGFVLYQTKDTLGLLSQLKQRVLEHVFESNRGE